MPRLYLVRHGKAAATWAESDDPGLDPEGHAQAESTARSLAALPRMDLRTSPLRRARETAVPLERAWDARAIVDPAIAEIPSLGMSLAERGPWLRTLMQGRWDATTPELQAWRRAVVNCLLGLRNDTVLFSHFVAINVAAGEASGDGRVVVFSPDNASVTVFETGGGRLTLVEKGREGATVVR